MPKPKQFLTIALVSLFTLAVVARTPLAGYVTGEKKIGGVL